MSWKNNKLLMGKPTDSQYYCDGCGHSSGSHKNTKGDTSCRYCECANFASPIKLDGIEVFSYRCSHCGETSIREIKRAWVPSVCSKNNRIVHMVRLDESGKPIDYHVKRNSPKIITFPTWNALRCYAERFKGDFSLLTGLGRLPDGSVEKLIVGKPQRN